MITDERRAALYPQEDEIGDEGAWDLPLQDGKALEIDAVFLGVASARQDKHNHSGDHAPAGRRCPACRWYEPRIFKVNGGKYLLYTLGCSDMPGEIDVPRYRYATDAYEAIFNMATHDPEKNTRFLTTPARMMFLMAAESDPAIADALLAGGWVHSLNSDHGQVWRTA